MTSKVYSDRLGALSDAQFAAACERLNLGVFVSAAPTSGGLFGQNVFITTREGQFVLRGAPHWVKDKDQGGYRPEDRWQFAKEAYFVQRLREATEAPAPWPYLRDETYDIFGWPYAIMPRMPGICFDERTVMKLPPEDRRAIAIAAGEMLAEMQRLAAPFAGDFDTFTIELTPYPHGAIAHTIAETHEIADSAAANDALTSEDAAWIETVAQSAAAAGDAPATYVHCDYKLNNMTFAGEGAAWRVSGLFDFHEARFADGALDLARQACSYLDTEPALAGAFIAAYRAHRPSTPDMRARLPLYVINDRLKIWAYFVKPPRPSWSQGKTFRQWAEPYVTAIAALL